MPTTVGMGVTLILLRFLSLRHTSAQELPEATLPVAPHCGAPLSRTLGGLQAQINEFPWTALIEYRRPDGTTRFLCGGSLINFRYVLTAAHCIKKIPRGYEVTGVRLGEWDLAADQDCKRGYCADAPVNVDVEKIITHEDYGTNRSHYNDIALIRLNKTMERSDSVSPVCLPIDKLHRFQEMDGKNVYAAGWGNSAKASKLKLKIPMKAMDSEKCAIIYSPLGLILKDTQMCATELNSRNKCGNIIVAGNPLTKEEYLNDHHGLFNYLYGITSIGPAKCDTQYIPDVYTNVAKYIDWIQSKLE